MPDSAATFAELIAEYLQSRPNAQKLKPDRVAKRLGVRKRDFDEFFKAWDIAVGQPNKSKQTASAPSVPFVAAVPSGSGRFRGLIKRVGVRGGVFIGHPLETVSRGMPVELMIGTNDLKDAQAGDEVLVQLTSRRAAAGKPCGRVIEVLERATNTFVGNYDEFDGQGYVRIDGRNFNDPIWVGDPGAKGAAPGDKVVIEMLRFPSQAHGGEAVLTQVLGAKGEPGVDLQSVIHEFGLPDDFPAEVLHAASQQAELFDESDLRGRLDLTHETIVTIDPADARDFDDAISLARNEAGHWVLGVHIADVAHFVQPGSPLDREARRRGTSVYLPTRVLPMLPEVISNGLASLQQGKVRYTNTAFIEFTPDGIPVHTDFKKSAIKATRRFAYEEVLPIIQNTSTAKVSEPVRRLLSNMHELAMILRRRRFAAGSLDLNLPEVKLDFDKHGRVSGAHEVEHDVSHQMIEEFMLAANIAVATKISDIGIGFLRRTHEEPDSLKLQAFAKFVQALGFSVGELNQERGREPPRRPNRKSQTSRLKSRPSPHDSPMIVSKAALQKLLKQVSGTPAEHAINYALLRSMKQANYSGIPIGHYALSVSEYCHFTSPIRRYPDLTIHRLFDEFATGRTPRGPSEAELEIHGQHCSDTERRAAMAERELTKLKLLAFMSDRVGEEMDATITGVERFGMFCRGVQMPVEGFIHISVLSESDYFEFDAASISLQGRQTGRKFQLGDRVRVQIAFVNLDRRELDLRLAADPTRSQRPSAKSAPQADRPRKKKRRS